MLAFLDFDGVAAFSSRAIIGAMLPYLLLGLAIPYAVLYIRDSRNDVHDPQIGLKAVLFFSFSVALLLFLSGLTTLVVDILNDDAPAAPLRDRNRDNPPGHVVEVNRGNKFTDTQRVACGLMLSGFVAGLITFTLILVLTNTSRYPAAARVFVGWRLAIHSVVLLAALTVLCIQLVQNDVPMKVLKPVFGILLVWTPSAVVHLVLLRAYNAAPPARLQRPVFED